MRYIYGIFDITLPNGVYLDFNVLSFEDGIVEIAHAYGWEGPESEFVIPGKIRFHDRDYTVVAIGRLAFQHQYNLTKVVIPDTVTRIEANAFEECTRLKEVVIPDTVTYIGPLAFANCSSLETLSIPPALEIIELGTFRGCHNIKSLTIPDTVTEIGDEAFEGCFCIDKLEIPSSVTSIGSGAFWGCYGIDVVKLSPGIKKIPSSAFMATPLRSIDIPDGVRSIEGLAFYGCGILEQISIPATVRTIGEGAFLHCEALLDKLAKAGRYFMLVGSEVNRIEDGRRIRSGCTYSPKRSAICGYQSSFLVNDSPLAAFIDYDQFGTDEKDVKLYEVEPVGEDEFVFQDHSKTFSDIKIIRRIRFSELGAVVNELLSQAEAK